MSWSACCTARRSRLRPIGSTWSRPASRCRPTASRRWSWRWPPPARRRGGAPPGNTATGCCRSAGAAPRPGAVARHKANWDLYEEEARRNGHVPDRRKWRLVGLMHIAETREQARKNVEFGLTAFTDYFHDVATFPIVPPDVADPYAFMVDSGTACIGTPDDAIAYIERLLAGSGGFGAGRGRPGRRAVGRARRDRGAVARPARPGARRHGSGQP